MAKTKVHGEYLDPSVISGQTQVTAVGADSVLIFDATDNALKKALISDITFNADQAQVFNESGNDVDFRIESNDSANMLFVDGGNNKVLVQANNTASVTDSASMVAASVFEINGNAGEGSDILRFFAMADGTGNYGLEVSNSGGNAQYDLCINPINGGNVGINTTSPSDLLHVKGSSSANVLIDAATDNATLTLQAGSSDSGAEGAFAVFVQNTTNKWQLGMDTDNDFRLYNYATSSEALCVNPSGQVGIGTESPSAPLHIVGDGNTGQRVHVGTSSAHQIYLGNTGGVSSVGTLTDHDFQLIRNGSAKLLTSSTGISINGVTVCSDKITHGNGELDLYDGGSNTILKNGVTNGNIKLQTIVTGVGAANTLVAGDGALGQVDTPYQSSFHAYSPAVTNGGNNIIIFGSTYHNTGSDYDTSNGRYTAPRGGRYLFTASVLMNPSSTSSYERILFAINANTGSTTYGDTLTIPGNSSYDSLNLSVILYLGANDYVTVQNAGQSPTYGTSYGAFTGYYLG